MKLYLASLGCAKNLVDSEVMLGRLIKAGWRITQDPQNADTIIVNTCSFIESAVNESIDTILELARFKSNGTCRRLIIIGCLPERYREAMVETLPEVDVFLGTGAFDKIVTAANDDPNIGRCFLPDPNIISYGQPEFLRVRSSSYMAYLKVAEGCSRHCTYCIIPKLRGKHRSRHLEDIVSEARDLISSGVKELILIAQDTTHYGTDLHPPVPLHRLLEKISEISDNIWIRILYGHVESIEDSFIRTVAEHRNICSYFDVPIQHASDRILKKMGRNYTSEDLYRLFDNIRSAVPDAALRTAIIVGFPGETDKDFETLSTFIQDICFDNLGVFIYSDAEDLPSHKLPGHIPKSLAMDRYNRLMAVQQKISLLNNRKHIGKNYDVLVEESMDNNLYKGRTFFQAPEVDGTTDIHSRNLPIGSFVHVRIEEASEYDLKGKVV
ncbi:MAG: 30S ribosomal protein S12 methylthiotransferase RimO [Proteobacteria bacterium]|nr:30S ribosomal protein S12 methylthiotransferase RimO [Pseudomonadota bacterium]